MAIDTMANGLMFQWMGPEFHSHVLFRLFGMTKIAMADVLRPVFAGDITLAAWRQWAKIPPSNFLYHRS